MPLVTITAATFPAPPDSHVLLGPGLRWSSQRSLHCPWCLNSLKYRWRCLWSCPWSPRCSHWRPCTGTREGSLDQWAWAGHQLTVLDPPRAVALELQANRAPDFSSLVPPLSPRRMAARVFYLLLGERGHVCVHV